MRACRVHPGSWLVRGNMHECGRVPGLVALECACAANAPVIPTSGAWSERIEHTYWLPGRSSRPHGTLLRAEVLQYGDVALQIDNKG